jgi:hypothetical protein
MTSRSFTSQALFFRILGRLKERSAYFTFREIRAAAIEENLALKDSSLKVYLSGALKQGHVHDAGRGWYSRLSEPVPLDPRPVSRLIRAVEKAFPLLDFTVWSTAQLNPWMHHLIAQPVTFLNAHADTLDSAGETLGRQGWKVALDPTPKEGPKAISPGKRAVVLRPMHSKEPAGGGRQAPIEKILVDLVVESDRAALMDVLEAQGVVAGIASGHLVQVSTMHRYSVFRGVRLAFLEGLNLRQTSRENGDS